MLLSAHPQRICYIGVPGVHKADVSGSYVRFNLKMQFFAFNKKNSNHR